MKSSVTKQSNLLSINPEVPNIFQYIFTDPLFFSYDLNKNFAEATPEEKNSVSHRGRALQKMIPIIKRNK